MTAYQEVMTQDLMMIQYPGRNEDQGSQVEEQEPKMSNGQP